MIPSLSDLYESYEFYRCDPVVRSRNSHCRSRVSIGASRHSLFATFCALQHSDSHLAVCVARTCSFSQRNTAELAIREASGIGSARPHFGKRHSSLCNEIGGSLSYPMAPLVAHCFLAGRSWVRSVVGIHQPMRVLDRCRFTVENCGLPVLSQGTDESG